MTRTLLATVFALALASPSFAASDDEVRQLALSLQNSGAAVEHIGVSDFSVATETVNFMTKQSSSLVVADGVNDLAISRLALATPADLPDICIYARCIGESDPPPVLHPIDLVIDTGGGLIGDDGDGGFMPILPPNGDGSIDPGEPQTGGGLLAPEPPLSMEMPLDGDMYTDGGMVAITVP